MNFYFYFLHCACFASPQSFVTFFKKILFSFCYLSFLPFFSPSLFFTTSSYCIINVYSSHFFHLFWSCCCHRIIMFLLFALSCCYLLLTFSSILWVLLPTICVVNCIVVSLTPTLVVALLPCHFVFFMCYIEH